MMTLTPDYDTAIRAMWTGRDLQTQKQIESGKIDAGTRGSVTGGQHMTPLQDVIAAQFTPLVELGAEIRKDGVIPLPGYYRRAKNWDIVVTFNGILVAALECKSQVGSFGNNFNNRAEEAIGNAVDIWRANESGLLGGIRPWLGFVFVIEDTHGSTNIVRDRGEPLYPADPIFGETSYVDRYRILFQRLVRERLYDAACLIPTRRGEGISAHSPGSDGPARSTAVGEISADNLTAAIAGRVAYIAALSRSRGRNSSRQAARAGEPSVND